MLKEVDWGGAVPHRLAHSLPCAGEAILGSAAVPEPSQNVSGASPDAWSAATVPLIDFDAMRH